MSRDALVVGINKYESFSKLRAPAQDAEAIAQCLQTYGDFRVRRMPEIIQENQPAVGQRTAVTTRALEAALIQLFKPQGKSVPHTALFYFSGHGFQRNAGIQEGYLVTSDTNPEMGNFGLSLFWLRRLFQESPVQQRIVILDCCHSGEILNFLEADPGAQNGIDRLFMAASREFEAAYESLNSPLSVFTQAILKGLDPHETPSGIVSNYALISTVSQQLKSELQQPLFESSGSDIILTRTQSNLTIHHGGNAGNSVDTKASIQCPYPGLRAFTEAEGDRFFGREDLTNQLLQQVNTQTFCSVLGASGIGKTSLIRAGLMHQLRQGKRIPGSDRWQIRYITPADTPLQNLAAAFIDPTLEPIMRVTQLHQAESFLQEGEGSLNRLAQASLSITDKKTALQHVTHLQHPHGSTPPSRKFVLIIDQLETLFTPHATALVKAQREVFIQQLIQAIHTPTPELTIVIVARSNQLNLLKQYPTLTAAIRTQALWVPPLTYDQLKTAITKPARQVGLGYEQTLLYTMLLDVAGTPGELALVQHILVELWQHCVAPVPVPHHAPQRLDTSQHLLDQRVAHVVKQLDIKLQQVLLTRWQTHQARDIRDSSIPGLTMAAYTHLGGLRTLLNQRATQAFERLDPADQPIAQRIFLSLCELGEGTEDSCRRVHITELVNDHFPLDAIRRVLNHLVREHLIVIDGVVPNTTSKSLTTDSAVPTNVALPEAAWSSTSSSAPSNALSEVTRWATASDIKATVNLHPSQVSSLIPPLNLNPLNLNPLNLTPNTEKAVSQLPAAPPVETIDIVHESLIRNWDLLRQWLSNTRDLLRQQRKLEAAAQDWHRQGRPLHPDYLLSGHQRLEAEDFANLHPQQPSSLATTYLTLTRQCYRRHRLKRHMLALLAPCALLAGMVAWGNVTPRQNQGTVNLPPPVAELDHLVEGQAHEPTLSLEQALPSSIPVEFSPSLADLDTLKTLVFPLDAFPPDAFPSNAFPSNAFPSNAFPSDAFPPDAFPSDKRLPLHLLSNPDESSLTLDQITSHLPALTTALDLNEDKSSAPVSGQPVMAIFLLNPDGTLQMPDIPQ